MSRGGGSAGWIKAINAHQVKPFLGELAEVTRRLHGHWQAAAATGTAVDVQAEPRNLLEAFVAARDDDGSALDDNEIYANTVTARLAGEDTTANTLAWMIHFLSQNVALQAGLRDAVAPRATTPAGRCPSRRRASA